jgi:hypothetical protein
MSQRSLGWPLVVVSVANNVINVMMVMISFRSRRASMTIVHGPRGDRLLARDPGLEAPSDARLRAATVTGPRQRLQRA